MNKTRLAAYLGRVTGSGTKPGEMRLTVEHPESGQLVAEIRLDPHALARLISGTQTMQHCQALILTPEALAVVNQFDAQNDVTRTDR